MSKKIGVLLFAVIITAIPLLSLFSPYRSISEQENRVLASFPEFSLSEVVSKRFMNGFGDFVSDHIAFRDRWTAVKARAVTLIGKRDNKGVYLGKNCLIENIAGPDESVYKPNAEAIKRFAEQLQKPVYLLLAPTAAETERGKLPAFATTADQNKFIQLVRQKTGAARMIDVASALSAHKNEYIYYRTDHHWTTLGAYYAYASAGETLGYTPMEKSEFDIRKASDDFNGTLYFKSGYRGVKPDEIFFYTPKRGSPLERLVIGAGKEAQTFDSIYFTDWLSKNDKYSAFLNGNQAVEKIYTKTQGKKLLILKDSYAHSLVPFLMNHYSLITMVDTRYLVQPLGEVLSLQSYDQVLFIYNTDTFNTDTTIKNIL